MLSVIVFSPPDASGAMHPAGPLLRTLAALVPAAIEGAIRDVTLMQVGAAGGVSAIADEAGCRFVEDPDFSGGLARSVAGARSSWIFVVKAGTVPSRIFVEEAARALDGTLGPGGALLLRRARTGLARLVPAPAPVVGVILPRARLAERRCASFIDVVRRAKPARTLTVAADVRA